MHMSDIAELLSGVFARHGYRVKPAPAGGLLAANELETILVDWTSDPVTAEDVSTLATHAPTQGASRVLVVGVAPNLPAPAIPAGSPVTYWPRERIAAEIGETVLSYADIQAAKAKPKQTPARADNPKDFRSLIARASGASDIAKFGAHYLPSKPTRSAEPKAGTQVLPNAFGGTAALAAPNASLVRDGVKGNRGIAMTLPNRPKEQAPAAPATSPLDGPTAVVRGREISLAPNDDTEIIVAKPKAKAASTATPGAPQVLKPALGKVEAANRALAKVGKVRRTTLELVPHIAFTYDFSLPIEGAQPIAGKGAVLVNAVDGGVVEIPSLEYAEAPLGDDPQTALAKFEAADVYENVKKHLSGRYARDVKITKVVDDVEMIQTRKINPSPVEMNLAHQGVVLAPVWVVEGEKGTAPVSGLAG